VSVVIATYNRSDVLRSAIASVLHQTRVDWELIVVGDRCTDDTEAVVASFGDPRIQFRNLVRNGGDQSGPNNVGAAMAKAPVLAFLNHDDLWFPDHLDVGLEALDALGADVVFAANAILASGATGPDAVHNRGVVVEGVGRRGRYDPGDLNGYPQVSTLVVRSAAWAAIRGLRHSLQLAVVPSRDFAYRAQRHGLRVMPTGVLTVVSSTSLERPRSYTSADPRQAQVLSAMSDPAFRALLLAADPRNTAEAERRVASDEPLATRMWRRALRLAALRGRSPVGPAELDARLRQRLRNGQLMADVRRFRGLDAQFGAATDRERLRRAASVHAPPPRVGDILPTAGGGAGLVHLARGWSYPEAHGTWNDGPSAEVILRLDGSAPGSVRIELDVLAHVDADHPVQRVTLRCGPVTVDAAVTTPSALLAIEAPATRPALVVVTLDFPDAWRPAPGGDRRQLALAIRSLAVRPLPPKGSTDGS